jgi:hypothetical protein
MVNPLLPQIDTLLARYKSEECALEEDLSELQRRWHEIWDRYKNTPLVHVGAITLPDLSHLSDEDRAELSRIEKEQDEISKRLTIVGEKIEVLTMPYDTDEGREFVGFKPNRGPTNGKR